MRRRVVIRLDELRNSHDLWRQPSDQIGHAVIVAVIIISPAVLEAR